MIKRKSHMVLGWKFSFSLALKSFQPIVKHENLFQLWFKTPCWIEKNTLFYSTLPLPFSYHFSPCTTKLFKCYFNVAMRMRWFAPSSNWYRNLSLSQNPNIVTLARGQSFIIASHSTTNANTTSGIQYKTNIKYVLGYILKTCYLLDKFN